MDLDRPVKSLEIIIVQKGNQNRLTFKECRFKVINGFIIVEEYISGEDIYHIHSLKDIIKFKTTAYS